MANSQFSTLNSQFFEYMLVKTFGSAICGVKALMVTVEVSVDVGVNFLLVGLPDSAVKESQQRIATAISQYGYHIPGKKVVINMAPADLKKEGAAYDLTIAIGILARTNDSSIANVNIDAVIGSDAVDSLQLGAAVSIRYLVIRSTVDDSAFDSWTLKSAPSDGDDGSTSMLGVVDRESLAKSHLQL